MANSEFKAMLNEHGQCIIINAADAGKPHAEIDWYNVGIGQCGTFAFEPGEDPREVGLRKFGHLIWDHSKATVRVLQLREPSY